MISAPQFRNSNNSLPRVPEREAGRENLIRIEASILDGSWKELREKLQLRDPERVFLSGFVDLYLREWVETHNKPATLRRKQASFDQVKRHFGRVELKNLTAAQVHRFVHQRKMKGAASGTVNRDIAALKHMLSFAVQCGVLRDNPLSGFKMLKEPLKPVRRFSDAEVRAVIDQLKVEVRPIAIFIRETGCRGEEALSLQHWQVQLQSRLVVFTEETKSGKFRYVPLTADAVGAVKALPRLSGCPYVFYNLHSKTRWCNVRKC